jgi:hypothetical protein
MKFREITEDYLISDTGVVISLKSNIALKTRLDRYGYELVTLWINGKAFTKKVHRLVAQAFVPNPLNLPTVNHKDGIKTHNISSNLEWMSIKENMQHGFETGLHKIGEGRIAGRKATLAEKDIVEIKKLIIKGYGNSTIGKLFKVSCGAIYSIRIGKSWRHVTVDGFKPGEHISTIDTTTSKLTQEVLSEIRYLIKEGYSDTLISNVLKINRTVIYDIRIGKTHSKRVECSELC